MPIFFLLLKPLLQTNTNHKRAHRKIPISCFEISSWFQSILSYFIFAVDETICWNVHTILFCNFYIIPYVRVNTFVLFSVIMQVRTSRHGDLNVLWYCYIDDLVCQTSCLVATFYVTKSTYFTVSENGGAWQPKNQIHIIQLITGERPLSLIYPYQTYIQQTGVNIKERKRG